MDRNGTAVKKNAVRHRARGDSTHSAKVRGVSPTAFDGRGNYTLGVKDQLIFPEIDYSKVDKTKGMNISITTTARTDAEGVALLKQMGMPFRAQ